MTSRKTNTEPTPKNQLFFVCSFLNNNNEINHFMGDKIIYIIYLFF